MKRTILNTLATCILAAFPSVALAQDSHDVTLHVSPRWSECSIQLDPSLTQDAWRQFTEEAGLVVYFRPLIDARPMGAGRRELSVHQWNTAIDDTEAAWNDTFVHPDSAHWLFEGSGLTFPGLTFRAGVTNRIDAGVYFAKNPNANYGFYGGQVQYGLTPNALADWAASARVSFVSLFGPEDLDFTVYGLDLLASREYVPSRWLIVSPYAGFSTYLSRTHEKSAAVDLRDESVGGARAMIGAVARVSALRIAAEYTTAKVNSRSLKVGVAF